jgi:hypothetical protein
LRDRQPGLWIRTLEASFVIGEFVP